ncbi:hypothetical protein ABFX02_09G008200 [Erythranthe guttata]
MCSLVAEIVKQMSVLRERLLLNYLAVAKSKLQQKDKAIKDANDGKNEILARIDGLEGIIRSLFSKTDKIGCPPTPSSELGSNSTSLPIHPTENVNNVTGNVGASLPSPANTSTENRGVFLCDKFGRKIAKGYIVTDSTSKTCHFKNVRSEEKKVYIEEVIDPSARLWDPPQGGYDTLAGFIQGGYVIWLENWLVGI